jgi:polyisoprenoid-binding protein YceI
MAIHAGRHRFGTDKGRITLRTHRDGLAAQAGHDLTIDAARWSGELEVAPDQAPAGLTARIDLTALIVKDGSGGIKPLTERDKREIAVTARKLLTAERFPEATFTATAFRPGADGGGTIDGTLALAGRSAAQRVQVRQSGPGHFLASATVRQTDYGIKPYSAFLGSLKVSDAVDVEIELDLSTALDESAAS